MMVRATPSWSLSYSVMASAASRSSDSALIMAMPWPAACSMGMSLMLSPNAQASARRSPRCSHNHVRAVPLVAPSPMTSIFMAYERVTSMPSSVSSAAAMALRSAGSCQYMAMRSSVSTSSILLSISMSIGVRVRLSEAAMWGSPPQNSSRRPYSERGRKHCPSAKISKVTSWPAAMRWMRWAMPRSSGRLKMHVARETSVGVPASSCQTLAPLAQTA